MHPFLVLSGASEATLRQWGNIHKLYRKGHKCCFKSVQQQHLPNHALGQTVHFLEGKTPFCTVCTQWQGITMAQSGQFHRLKQTNKFCSKNLQQQQLPNHAWGSVWLYYGMHPFSNRPRTSQKKGANHTHSVWVGCPGMRALPKTRCSMAP